MMNELIAKIEQWAEDRNIIKGSEPIDQAMKLFSEVGELADNVGKGKDIKDDVGDIFVVLTIITAQTGHSISVIEFPKWAEDTNKNLVLKLQGALVEFIEYKHNGNSFASGVLKRCLNILSAIAANHGTTLQECIQIAYNDIKDRRGILVNGVFIKESDPAYQDALDNIEADKRMASQKRISVNIEDL